MSLIEWNNPPIEHNTFEVYSSKNAVFMEFGTRVNFNAVSRVDSLILNGSEDCSTLLLLISFTNFVFTHTLGTLA